jgi:hypothetical protein
MGRAIIINSELQSPVPPENLAERFSTDVFDVIVEATRNQFRPQEAECARLCFMDLDERSQEYIALDAVDSACFKAFVRACEAGLAEYQATGKTAWGLVHLDDRRVAQYAWEWSELIKKLQADPRYKSTERS